MVQHEWVCALQADSEEMRGETLGRKGGPELESTHRRALLQARDSSDGTGQGKAPPSPERFA